MSKSGEFCPRCGDDVPERPEPLPGEPRDRDAALCDACYFEQFDLVDAPDRIEVLVCSRCGAVHRGNRWVDVGAKDYTDVAVDEVAEALGVHLKAEQVQWGVEPEQVDQNTIRMHCTFSGIVRGTPVEEQVVVPVKVSRGTCKRCGRISGGAYAGEVQVRADEREPTKAERERAMEIAHEMVQEREADGDRDAFVTEAKEVDDGADIKLSTNKLGRALSKRLVEEFGGDFEEYATLVTEDSDGNEVYRVTFSVRLPRYRPDEIIDPEDGDGPVLVTSVRGNLKGTRLASGERYEARFDEEDAPDALRLGEREEAVETTVVAVEDEHAVQVLDPETFETVSIPRPDFFDTNADEVLVLKSRAGLHMVPGEDA
ncbi:NMD3 family protein [Halolamina pelagica]|uniref:NMD3 family protein n=1 Tax=Halolamina pelagica TaxID=699431 RepID=A0A0N8HZU5_9EURY|nr:60S ribosomal export protein NMD3 [Halolamina pelagica]KPN30483.1 NMD3 family protein [Halolamina pelagica]